MAGGISLHVIDVTRAVPASGLQVEILALDDGGRSVFRGRLNEQGGLEGPITEGAGILPGRYELVLRIGDYYRAEGFDLPHPAFLEEVPFRFGIADTAQHYHLPMKMSPWGFSLFRGG